MSVSREELEQELKTFSAAIKVLERQSGQLKDLINNSFAAIGQAIDLHNKTFELHQKILDRLTDKVKALESTEQIR